MPVSFMAYFVPVFLAFIGGSVAQTHTWIGVVISLVAGMVQLYVLDRRDPNGLWRRRLP